MFGVGAGRAAVLEAVQRDQRTVDHLVRSGGIQACDERDATGVVLVCGVVETLAGLCGSARWDVRRDRNPPRIQRPSQALVDGRNEKFYAKRASS